jgi:peptidoglycan/LPS O-acetylase OafA/YrhL
MTTTEATAVAPTLGRRTIGGSFSGRHNGLNLIRLVLATLVLVDHAFDLGGWSLGTLNLTNVGTISVYGFFGISGYLIAGSAVRNRPGRYLWQRFLRIFPGLWVCLAVTGLLLGIVAYLHAPLAHCGLSCYFSAPDGPFSYVYRNALLPNAYLYQFSIAGTPRGVPAPGIWDGSLWTLFFEFLCYLILVAFGLAGLLRRRAVTLVAAVVLWGSIFVITLNGRFDKVFSIFHNANAMNLMKFAAIFLVGAVIYLYRDVVPDSGWIALACGIGYLASLFLPNGGFPFTRNPIYFFTASDLFAPLVAYPLLWLGIHLPPGLQKIGARNDYSYGVYIYAYPASQMLAIFGVQRWGVAVFVILSALLTAPLAVGSWWLVEKRALSLKRVGAAGLPEALRHPLRSRHAAATEDTVLTPGSDFLPPENGEWNGRQVVAPALEGD